MFAVPSFFGFQKAGFGPTYDADAEAFFDRVTAAGGTLSTTEKDATNQLVLDLKANSLWTPIKAIYPMVGSSAAACAQNLKSSSFTGTFTSGWTFASTGVTGNGTSAYFDTNVNENTTMTLNNIHISHYSRTNNTSAVCDIGLLDTNVTVGTHTITYSSGNAAVRNTDISGGFTATSSTAGMFINSRSSFIETKYFYNSSLFNTITSASVQKSNLNYFLGARNNSNTAALFSNRQYAFASIGDGLTDTQASNFYTAVQAFQTTLSRNV
jgi:hypothetical protein